MSVMRQEYRELSDKEQDLIKRIKDLGEEFVSVVGELEPSREVSLAQTKMEEAVMWAVKHITR